MPAGHGRLLHAASCAGTVKGLTPGMLEDCKCHLILGNTYHLGNRPGASAVEELGGLHKFSGWNRAMLTDSGAAQVGCQVPKKHGPPHA